MQGTTLWVLDRIEDGALALLISDAGERREVELHLLPPGSREGQAFREVGEEGELRYRYDPEETERLGEEIRALRASLRRGPSGPLSL